jgi:hypothetical protein
MQEAQTADVTMAVPVEYVPAKQEMQELALLEATAVEYVPAMHERQLADVVTPTPVLYVPAGQISQFTPDQLSGGCSWTPTGKFCQVLLQPPTPT